MSSAEPTTSGLSRDPASTAGARGFRRVLGTIYDLAAEWRPTARLGAMLEWGASLDAMYASIHRLGALPDGCTVLDVPCGGGLAFQGLQHTQDVRYLAVDVSEHMLARAARRAARRALGRVEFHRGDVHNLPFAPGSIDVCVSYNGLQCFGAPAVAVEHIARCLKPGGHFEGTTVVRGQRRRSDWIIDRYRRVDAFGPGGTIDDLDDWLERAGLIVELRANSGALAAFRARKPAVQAPAPASARDA